MASWSRPVIQANAQLSFRSWLQQFFIDGGTVVWAKGADIAPETLYEAVKHSTAGQQRAGTGGAPHH
jgi:hypothetical protein